MLSVNYTVAAAPSWRALSGTATLLLSARLRSRSGKVFISWANGDYTAALELSRLTCGSIGVLYNACLDTKVLDMSTSDTVRLIEMKPLGSSPVRAPVVDVADSSRP